MLFPTTIGSGVQFIRVFLDASKAFDRVEHWSLFKKLIGRNVPLVVVRLLVDSRRQCLSQAAIPRHCRVLYLNVAQK